MGTWLRFAKLPPVLNIWEFCFSLEIKPVQVVPQLPWESEDRLWVGKDPVKLPHLRTSDCFSWEQVYHRLCLLGHLRGWNSFLSLQTPSRLTVTHITVWFNAPVLPQEYNGFLSLLPLWRGFLDWGKIWVFKIMFLQHQLLLALNRRKGFGKIQELFWPLPWSAQFLLKTAGHKTTLILYLRHTFVLPSKTL